MASFVRRGGKVRGFIRLKGVSDTGTFTSMGEYRAWAARRESEILAGARGELPNKTLAQALEKYREEVSPGKKGARWELIRIGLLLRDPIAQTTLADLDSSHVAQWRDRRLNGSSDPQAPTRLKKPVKGATVRRDWNLLSSVCSVAISEWKWLRFNPFSKAAGARRPKKSAHRDEILLPEDLAALQAIADARPHRPGLRWAMRAVRFAIETAMRSSEVIFLGENPERVNTTTRVARLPDTKNGNRRDVPLSKEAVRLWEQALADDTITEDGVWGLTDGSRDSYWRELRDLAALQRPEVARLTFHDTRHTATTQLAKKLPILDLARMTGHTDLKELMAYYNPSASEIASRLD